MTNSEAHELLQKLKRLSPEKQREIYYITCGALLAAKALKKREV